MDIRIRLPALECVRPETKSPDLQGPNGLLKGLLKGPPYGHGLTHRLHGCGQYVFSTWKFFKGPARDFDHAVINSRLKGGKRFTGDIIGDFIQGISNSEFGSYLGNGEAGSLGGQGRTSGYPGIHLNDHHLAIFRVNSKLDVGTAGLHANFPDNGNGCIAHGLIFSVCEGLRRGHGNAVTCVNTHGIKIFNGADDDHIVLEVPHDLQFIFLPSYEGFLYNDLGNHAGIKACLGKVLHLHPVIGHSAAGPSHGKTCPDNQGITDSFRNLSCLVHILCDAVLGHAQADMAHGVTELLPLFGLANNRN